jgi:hypothetical protein
MTTFEVKLNNASWTRKVFLMQGFESHYPFNPSSKVYLSLVKNEKEKGHKIANCVAIINVSSDSVYPTFKDADEHFINVAKNYLLREGVINEDMDGLNLCNL